MARSNDKESLRALVEPVVSGLGCKLWGIEQLPHGNRTLVRIFIDKADGVDVEDCARVSRQVSSLLDVEDPLLNRYTLEVSSPGMDRRLFTLEQFAHYTGADVRIRLKMPFAGRRKFVGLLHRLEGDEVVLREADEEYLLPFEGIEKANLVPDFQPTNASDADNATNAANHATNAIRTPTGPAQPTAQLPSQPSTRPPTQPSATHDEARQ